MNEKLREQYLEYLAYYGVEPRLIPADADTLPAATIEHLKASSKASGDEFIAELLEKTYREGEERGRDETRHPANVIIESFAEEVEQSIRAIERYRVSLKAEVFAGEFPTGSINAQAVKVDDGFLVLINSGLLVVIRQVTEFLVAGDPDSGIDSEANRRTIDGVVAVLEAYLRFGDPFLGPRPMSGGMKMLLVHFLGRACEMFVVAHEYGHVIAGHFDDEVMRLEQINTLVGPTSVIKKDWNQEFEADIVAHKILLGVDDYAKLDLGVIDRSYVEESDTSALFAGSKMKAAIAAPLIFLTIDAIISDVLRVAKEVAKDASATVRSDDTHPPARARMAHLVAPFEGFENKYIGFINFGGILWDHYDEICGRLVRALVGRPDTSTEVE